MSNSPSRVFSVALAQAAAHEADPVQPIAGIVWSDDGAWQARVARFHHCTDRIANRARSVVDRIDILIALVALLGVAVAGLGRTVYSGSHVLALLGVACGLTGSFAVGLRHRRARRDLWLHARYAAETARVAPYAAIAGRDPTAVEADAVDSLPADRDPAAWLRHLVAQQFANAPAVMGIDTDALAPAVVNTWLRGQHRYHDENSVRLARRTTRARRIAFWAFVVATVLAARAIVLDAFVVPPGSTIASWLAFFAVVTPAVASTAMLLVAQRESARLATRSRRMAVRFARLADAALEAEDRTALMRVLGDAVRLSAVECYEWSVLLGSSVR